MKINFGDGTLKGDLTAAMKLALMDGQTNAAALYERAHHRIVELEAVVAMAGRHDGSDWPDHCRAVVAMARKIRVE